ncbi:cysteine proteinase [Piedraia hortae CBS 480.64]|uniref:Ubiquitin carboxyl-terminal hydrolase n=1 Tax=Piedraia hortae CBS 480.64 TaxID=1314780 RepID=A0A6A7BR11_9PEZI|nr:cysteine proteinase [Piedraia hortae CBS 480.64]
MTSFFGKFVANSQSAAAAPPKKPDGQPQQTPLELHLADATGPVRADGSDKFFGFENYGSTCYCNSIIQCLYYSTPFRDNLRAFPPPECFPTTAGDSGDSPPRRSAAPYPNPSSPARKLITPTSPGRRIGAKVEESKDSTEARKRLALAAGPVLAMTNDSSAKYGMSESLYTSLKDIFEAIINHSSRIGVVSPHNFIEILRRENEMFRSPMHQDAHEFLNLLLNEVVDNVELFAKQQRLESNAHWVHDLFKGVLTSETRCLTCETASHRDEAFLDLSVDLLPFTSVTSCLRKFSAEEMLCARNKFHCDNCGGLQEAEKRMKIKRLPRILALHLKRFEYTEDQQRLQKLFHKVVYPLHLRLFNTLDEADDADRLYELYAVVVHVGSGPYHGHYISVIKTLDRGWLLFDDELVEPVDEEFVLSFFGGEPDQSINDPRQYSCAYILFYQETSLEKLMMEDEAEYDFCEMGAKTSSEAPAEAVEAVVVSPEAVAANSPPQSPLAAKSKSSNMLTPFLSTSGATSAAPGSNGPATGSGSGLSRLRHSSMRLPSKPRFFNKEKLAAADDSNEGTSLTTATSGGGNNLVDEKKPWNRFGLGKRKSQNLR